MSEVNSESSMQMLLQTLIDSQKALSEKLDQAVSHMATKDDIRALAEAIREAASKDEVSILRKNMVPRAEHEAHWTSDDLIHRNYDSAIADLKKDNATLATRITAMEGNQLPAWFWPAVTVIVMLIVPLISVVVAHFWKS